VQSLFFSPKAASGSGWIWGFRLQVVMLFPK